MRRPFPISLPHTLVMTLLLCAPIPGMAAHHGPVNEKRWVETQRAAADAMIARLDMTSFPNSIAPRRVPGKITLAQYGFTQRSTFDDGWAYARMADGSWQFGIFVLTDGARTKQLCITDSATGHGSYNATTAVEVERRPDGFWRSAHILSHVVGCA